MNVGWPSASSHPEFYGDTAMLFARWRAGKGAGLPASSSNSPDEKEQTFSWIIVLFLLGYLLIAFPGPEPLFEAHFTLLAVWFVLGDILGRVGTLTGRGVRINNICVLLAMIALPMAYEIYKDRVEKAVVHTREYQDSDARMTKAYFEVETTRRAVEAGLPIPPGQHHLNAEDRERIVSSFFIQTPTADLGGESVFRLSAGDDRPRLDGATSLAGIYRSFAIAVYGEDKDVACSRTPNAYRNLIDGKVDMIFVFRPSAAQLAEAKAKGVELTITPIGYDAFVFFVNKDNPVDGLSARQIRDIYSGGITLWRQVGGRTGRIIPFQRIEGSGSQGRMEQFMAGQPMVSATTETLHNNMSTIVRTMRYRNYRGAIGYSFLYYVDVMLRDHFVKLLAVDGVPPTVDTIRDGSYPLTEEICVVTAGTDNPNVQPFIDWMLSSQGQRLVDKVGYVPLQTAYKAEAP